MKTHYCLRCAKEIAHEEPRICRPCAVEVKANFADPERILDRESFDQACVSCGEHRQGRILHSPGEFTWCERCVDAGVALESS